MQIVVINASPTFCFSPYDKTVRREQMETIQYKKSAVDLTDLAIGKLQCPLVE